MFFRLGILNVRRQLARSLLVVLTLALAAISLTYSLAMQAIPPLRVAPFLSRFTGGEIFVVPIRWAGQDTGDVTGNQQYRPARLTASGASWLQWFFPEFYSDGFWFPVEGTLTEFIAPDMIESMQTFPGVDAALSIPTLPVIVRSNVGEVDVPIQISPFTRTLQELVTLSPTTLPTTGVFLNENAPVLKQISAYEQPPGQDVNFLLPKFEPNGHINYGEAVDYRLPFQSHVQVPTREVYWMDTAKGGVVSEVGYFTGDIAWIGEESWQELVSLISGDQPLPVSNLVLRVESLQVLDETLAALKAAYPQYTFLNMAQIEERFFQAGYMELFQAAPRSVVQQTEQLRLTIPASFNRVYSYLLVLIAGVLLGGHMLTGAAARNQEIGTLRALGARRRDIMTLGLSETIALTLIGVTIGFFPIRLLGIIMQLRGGQAFLIVMLGILLEYGQILALSLAAALTFALFPIWRLSTVAPMEVLRNE